MLLTLSLVVLDMSDLMLIDLASGLFVNVLVTTGVTVSDFVDK